MNTWLYLTAEGQDAPSTLWPCVLWSATGERQPMPLNEAAAAVQGRAVDVLLPIETCSWVRSAPWPTRRKPEAQALAFAVEEQLSEALEGVHLSVGARDRDGCYPVLVIGRERLAAVLDVLREANVEIRAVLVDADVLFGDQPGGAWWFGRWLLGGGQSARLALSPDDLMLLAPRLPKDLPCLDDREDRATLDQRLTQRRTQAINLLQGTFAPRGKRLPWRGGALAMLMLALLAWGASETRIRFLDSEVVNLTRKNEQQFKTLYPDQGRIVDMAAQLKALQNQPVEAQNTRIAGLVQLVEQVIGASPVEVQRIEYRAGEGWKIQLTASSFAELEQLRERGRQQGMPVRLDSANKVADRVHATLSVEDEA
ncbi:type II secretion system protein GspL [Pseudomonas sp. NFX15]|uniref:type II secretion system protein GspL n=1 Tax=Pseudomonas sp. NFX15 TaxID=2816958 RepID=UPI003B8B6DB1